MTVIAWDGKTLAADKRTTNEDGHIRVVTKITEVVWYPETPDGEFLGSTHFITAMAGDLAVGMECLSWFQDGGDPEAFPPGMEEGDTTFLAISREFGVQVWTTTPEPMYFEDDFLAFGCGRATAAAAMAMGMDAIAAVDLACKQNAFCGNGIDALMLPAETATGPVH